MGKICKFVGVVIFILSFIYFCFTINYSELFYINTKASVSTLITIGIFVFNGILIYVFGKTKEETKKILDYVRENNDAILKIKRLMEKQCKELNPSQSKTPKRVSPQPRPSKAIHEKLEANNDAVVKNRCEKCGTLLSPEEKYCVMCGAETRWW